MTNTNYIYAPVPDLAENFKCKVPMKGTRQLFVIDGGVQGTQTPLSVSFSPAEVPEEILQVINVRTANHPAPLEYRSRFHFDENSFGKLILCSHTFSDNPFITNEKVFIKLERNAVADIVLMQNEHNGAEHNSVFEIEIEAGARAAIVFLTLHGGKIRNDISISLNGKQAECDISGLYLVDGSQTVKNIIGMKHKVPSCRSRQLFKGILDNSATAYFSGLINVFPDAQKTEAYQENHNLILTKEAKVFSEPQLEIYADDVKCSHGATNGNLNENELFYMRSRGIPLKEAEILRQLAFANAVLDKITSSELKDRMMNLAEQRLRGEFSECRNCCKNCC